MILLKIHVEADGDVTSNKTEAHNMKQHLTSYYTSCNFLRKSGKYRVANTTTSFYHQNVSRNVVCLFGFLCERWFVDCPHFRGHEQTSLDFD